MPASGRSNNKQESEKTKHGESFLHRNTVLYSFYSAYILVVLKDIGVMVFE